MKKSIKENKRFTFIRILSLGIALVMMTALLSGCETKTAEESGIFYMKDDQLYYASSSDDEGQLLTSDYIDPYEFEDANHNAVMFANAASLSKDKNVFFYYDNISQNGQDLYRKKKDKPNEPDEKIDSDVYAYATDATGEKIAYYTIDYGTEHRSFALYMYEAGKKEKIAEDSWLAPWRCTDNLEKILYLREADGHGCEMFMWDADNGKRRLFFTQQEPYATDDFAHIYYLNDNAVYKWEESTEQSEKLLDNVYEIIKVYEDGTIYYVKEKARKDKVSDFVFDDMAGVDAGVENSYDKMLLDEIRKGIDVELPEKNALYELYYYDGQSEIMLTDKLVCRDDKFTVAEKASLIAFEIYNPERMERVKLSTFVNEYDIAFEVVKRMSETKSRCVASGADVIEIPQADACNFVIENNGQRIVYFADGEYEGNIYEIVNENGALKQPLKYDENVGKTTFNFTENGEVIYFKYYKEDRAKGDMYIDKQEIDYDVYFIGNEYGNEYWGVYERNGVIVYYTDYPVDGEGGGTINVLKNGEKKKLADGIQNHYIASNGDIYYITYDFGMARHTLYRYDGEESIVVDDEAEWMAAPDEETVKCPGVESWDSVIDNM